ncbi:MAG TPA: alkaline phosphatase family protein [Sphingobium sp.]|uniref:phospholipase C n=1 Tax=Sphingobium sp. TaxID=1912891 RepID=UPI002ED3DD74
MVRKRFTSTIAIAAALGMTFLVGACNDDNSPTPTPAATLSEQNALKTTTPIKHLVVIFGENESFDHYFGTYPQEAGTTSGQTWVAPSNVASPNNYVRNAALLTANPNKLNADNGGVNSTTGIASNLMNPFLLLPAQYDTTSQNHAYTPEQQATNNGKMDAFVKYTGRGTAGGAGAFGTAAQVMGYFDGSTVTGLWNYAQNYAMSDNAFTDSFGPSTPGAINVISGNTGGADKLVTGSTIADGQGAFTVTGDPDPTGDVCSNTNIVTTLAGPNIGDLLNANKITWGGFMGGFDPTITNTNGTNANSAGVKGCGRSTVSPHTTRTVNDYIPHHAWFQYYNSTLNKNHTRPSSVAMIGHTEANDAPGGATAVNHQYDLHDFIDAVKSGNFPSVSYIKAQAFQDAHPGNSNPLDEQDFVTNLVNFLMNQPDWASTAIIIAYDDSDGWYDHLAPTILTQSLDATADQVSGPGSCTGPSALPAYSPAGKVINGRCGPGTRTPLIVISPYARQNYVDSHPVTQASVVRFIEDNWLSSKRLGSGSNDATTGDLGTLFDFNQTPRTAKFCLGTDGKKAASTGNCTSTFS